jgi:hypothetical protein
VFEGVLLGVMGFCFVCACFVFFFFFRTHSF